MDGEKLLRDYAEDIEINDVRLELSIKRLR